MDQFDAIVTLLESIVSCKTVAAKEAQLRKFFSDFERHHRTQQTGPDDEGGRTASVYATLRLLVPGLDRDRKAYGLREKTLADAYVRALALERTNKASDAVRQLSPSAGGDLADRLVPLLRGRCPTKGTLTVAEVNRRLDALADRSGAGVQDELSYLIEHGTPLDHRWLVRIVLRNLRLGQLSGRRILQLYHPSAPALYDTTGDLRHVVQLLLEPDLQAEGGAPALLATDGSGAFVRLGHFVRPMLCQRVELRQVGELLARHTYWLETKMDGERFQVHKDGATFRYLSRNGVDYSATFGATPDQLDGTLTPMLAQLLAASVRSLILDGEMMVFDRRTLRYRDKCDGGADVKALRPGHGELRACFCVYDVLLLNGRSLIEMAYAERARLLGTLLVREQVGFVERCRREQVRDPQHLVTLLNHAIDARQEGVVLKREDAPYQPNRRAGGGWYKIKPDYIAGLVTDFDLLVLGGYYNARRTFVNVFVVGAAEQGPDGAVLRYLPVVKVSMGLSTAQWTELNRSLRPHWREASRPGPALAGGEPEDRPVRWGRAGPPDVCLEPTASIVLQLKGSELVRSDTYAAGYTIRFPRIVAIRSDKLPDEVCTVAELERLAGGSGAPGGTNASAVEAASESVLGASRKATKLAKRHVTLEDLAPDPTSKAAAKGAGGSKRRQLTIVTTTAGTTAPAADEGILCGRDICVMGAVAGSVPVRELEALVCRHGGRPVANPSPNTFAIVVTGAETFKVRKYSATGRWNVVRADWLLRATSHPQPQALEPFRPSDMLACTETTRLELAEAYDRYGDSYTRPVSPATFGALLRRESPWDDARLTPRELVHAEQALLGANAQRQRRLFRGHTARLYLPADPERADDDPEADWLVGNLRAQRELLRFVRHGGQWLRDTDPGPVAYVFVPARTAERWSTGVPSVIRWLRTVESRTTHAAGANDPSAKDDEPEDERATVLSTDWIGKSLECGQLCAVAKFTL